VNTNFIIKYIKIQIIGAIYFGISYLIVSQPYPFVVFFFLISGWGLAAIGDDSMLATSIQCLIKKFKLWQWGLFLGLAILTSLKVFAVLGGIVMVLPLFLFFIVAGIWHQNWMDAKKSY